MQTRVGLGWILILKRVLQSPSALLRVAVVVVLLNFLGFAATIAEDSQMPLSEVALFARCYAHMTQTDLPLNHSLRSQVAAGTLTAATACMQIFDGAALVATGANEGRMMTDTPEGRLVLANFNDLHRSWFPNDDLSTATSGEFDHYTGLLHDQSEAALHSTRALFTNGILSSEIVRGSTALEAMRTDGPSNFDTSRAAGMRIAHRSNFTGNTTDIDLNAQLVQTGELVGIRKMSLNSAKTNQMINTYGEPYIADKNKYYPFESGIRMHESLGGGLIGTKSYLLLNFGRPDNLPSNGGVRLPRRWSKSVMADLLCRDLPAIRLGDALALVQTTVSAATPPFRKSSSCMGCHGTIDPMASTARNLTMVYSSNAGVDRTTHQLFKWPTKLGPEGTIVDDDVDFFQRPTTGRLYFRSYDGTLINQTVSGVSGLGDAIATTNDFYVCLASRYYQYFTGIGVNLQDIGDPNNPAISAGELVYRNRVIELGLNLKSSQNLRSLIQSILNDPMYKTISMRKLGAP